MNEVGGNPFTRNSSITTKRNQKKHFKLGKYSVPLWTVAVLMIAIVSSGVLGYYIYPSFTVPLVVNEPIQIVGYPSQWSLYPGQTTEFNVTIRNIASLNYTVVLGFTSNDTSYQSNYIIFSDEKYTVVPGQQDLESWLKVSADAPAASLNVTVTVVRVTDRYLGDIVFNGDFEKGSLVGWYTEGVCSISSQIVHSGNYSAFISDKVSDSMITQGVMLPANQSIYFDCWVYPTEVGSLGRAYSPGDAFFFTFYDKSSMTKAFNVYYLWSWNDAITSANSTTNDLWFLLPFNVLMWNHLSVNLTNDVESYYKHTDFSNIILYSISAWYHYSSRSPGPFFVDDIKLST